MRQRRFESRFFPEVHIEQVEIVAKNQYLKIGILKQSKIRALGSGRLECQIGERRVEHAIRHLTVETTIFQQLD